MILLGRRAHEMAGVGEAGQQGRRKEVKNQQFKSLELSCLKMSECKHPIGLPASPV